MRETELYEPIKAYLEGQGYEVKAEVASADVVGCRGEEEPVIVELKTAFSLALVHQAVARQAVSDVVYMAAPRGKGRPFMASLKSMVTLARRLGRGLLLRLAYLAVLALAWLYAVATQDLYGALICFSLCGAAVGAMVLVDMRGILRAGIDPAEEQEARDALAKPVTAGD